MLSYVRKEVWFCFYFFHFHLGKPLEPLLPIFCVSQNPDLQGDIFRIFINGKTQIIQFRSVLLNIFPWQILKIKFYHNTNQNLKKNHWIVTWKNIHLHLVTIAPLCGGRYVGINSDAESAQLICSRNVPTTSYSIVRKQRRYSNTLSYWSC